MVPNANAEIDSLKDFNPAEVAVVHQEFANYIGGLNPQKNGSITLSEYRPNQLTYRSTTSSEQFAVFSEIWYGPDKGWTATIDGKPTEFIRTNYALRGMKVPAGDHTIVFRFDPKSYEIGKIVSFIFSSLIILALIYVGYQKRAELFSNAETPAKPATKKINKKK